MKLPKIKRGHIIAGTVVAFLVFGWFSFFNPVYIFKSVHGLPRGNMPSGEKALKMGTESPNDRAKTLNKAIHGTP